ncbi:hypothetical protein JQ636_12355 [Bradyrhizobium japonicum]|nr:hypothetical protein [Bradyrhizobium japonicum]
MAGFMSEFPDWESLANAPSVRLQDQLRPVGLWQRRADSFRRLASEMVLLGDLPRSREELERLPGIGQYIASAVMLMRDGRPEPLLDSNMARVLERYFGPRERADIRYDPYLQALSRQVVRCSRSLEASWAILDLAALVCLPRLPRCDQCPLATGCRFRLDAPVEPRGRRMLERKRPPTRAR